MKLFTFLNRSLSFKSLTRCFVAACLCGAPTLGDVPLLAQTQSVQVEVGDGEPPASLQFEPFDDQGGRLRLTEVEFEFEGEMAMDLTVENYDPQPYSTGEWSAEGYVTALLAFNSREGYEDGGPFFGLGGISITGVTGELGAGDGGGPFGGIPSDIVVTDSTSGAVDSFLTNSDPWTLAYLSQPGPLNATLGPLLDLLISPPPGSFFMDARATNVTHSGTITMTYVHALVGDANLDGELDADDIDRLYADLDSRDETLDLNGDQFVDSDDVSYLVSTLLGTTFGDSNLDGVFDSSDLVAVFAAGEYEDAVVGNSTWSSGDWNGDREFDTSDLVFAFQDGGYTTGAELNQAMAVPEPASLASLALLSMIMLRRRIRAQR